MYFKNSISLFTAFTTWHCCRLHYFLETFFWSYLYSNQQVWTSTFFSTFSYLVSSLIVLSSRQIDRQTYLHNRQTKYCMKIETLNKKPVSCHIVLSFVFLFFARCIVHIVIAGGLLCAPRAILAGKDRTGKTWSKEKVLTVIRVNALNFIVIKIRIFVVETACDN